jgi:hypothetical protein
MQFYHFGNDSSSAEWYSGIDMRGEVFMLNRNVKIQAEDVDTWGCQVVTSDFMEENDVYRYGNTIIDNVEIFNCSQYDTQKAGLRFEGATGKWSAVTNSVLHHGWGRGVQITNSENIYLKDNVIFDFIRFGVNVDTSNNITLDGNYIMHIGTRIMLKTDGFVDVSANLVVCAIIEGDICENNTIINNVVAGATAAGIGVYGHNCGDYSKTGFKNNIAHSINGPGAIIFPKPGSAS